MRIHLPVVILSREPQIVRHRRLHHRRLPERLRPLRPNNGAGLIHQLLRRPQMIVLRIEVFRRCLARPGGLEEQRIRPP